VAKGGVRKKNLPEDNMRDNQTHFDVREEALIEKKVALA